MSAPHLHRYDALAKKVALQLYLDSVRIRLTAVDCTKFTAAIHKSKLQKRERNTPEYYQFTHLLQQWNRASDKLATLYKHMDTNISIQQSIEAIDTAINGAANVKGLVAMLASVSDEAVEQAGTSMVKLQGLVANASAMEQAISVPVNLELDDDLSPDEISQLEEKFNTSVTVRDTLPPPPPAATTSSLIVVRQQSRHTLRQNAQLPSTAPVLA